MDDRESQEQNCRPDEARDVNPYRTAQSPGVNDSEDWTDAPGYSSSSGGESGMLDRPASVISPSGTGTPGDAGGPDLSGLPPSGPVDAPSSAAPHVSDASTQRGYDDDGGLGGAEAVGTGTRAGKELGQMTNRRLNAAGMPNHADLTTEANREDRGGLPASIGTGSAGAAIDSEAMAGVPDTGIEGNLSTRGLDERGLPDSGSTTDNPENLGMGSVDGPNMPPGD